MTAPLVGLAGALTLTACGVPPTGVIEAGEPASGMFSPAPRPTAPVVVSLHFLRDGDLTAYPRELEKPADLGPSWDGSSADRRRARPRRPPRRCPA
ncbi:hypothetical protein ACISU4_33295 [Streptomyces wuyuanensis]|uniref:hypothetical protein n=1 Tax=Streptomyces wuyuanensis TaxID=1196353 RepID=UPI003820802C